MCELLFRRREEKNPYPVLTLLGDIGNDLQEGKPHGVSLFHRRGRGRYPADVHVVDLRS